MSYFARISVLGLLRCPITKQRCEPNNSSNSAPFNFWNDSSAHELLVEDYKKGKGATEQVLKQKPYFTPWMREALSAIETSEFDRADVVAVSDGECGVGDELQKQWQTTKDAPTGTDPLAFSSAIAEQLLRPLIDKYQTSYVSNDISRFILLPTVKECGGIPLRPEGGMYFVPTACREVVMQLRAFTESLGKRQNALAYLSMFNVIDDADAKQDMQRHAHDALKAELRDLGHLLAKLLSNPERSVRATTVEKYLEEAERIAQEASLYRDLILLQAEDITAELDTLRQQFRAVVQGEATFGGEDLAGTTNQGELASTTTTGGQDNCGF